MKYSNNDPSLIHWLAYSHYYDGNYERAIEIANSANQGTELDKNYLKNIKGNSIWQKGNSKESVSIFKVLRNEQIPDDLRRELDIKISVIEQGSDAEVNIKSFFSTKDEVLQLSYLQNAIKTNPLYSLPHYLLGRFFFNKGEYDKAIPHLAEAYILELPGEELSNENLRILGISQYASERYNQAIATFEYLLLNESNESARKYAQDFIERSHWAKENQLK